MNRIPLVSWTIFSGGRPFSRFTPEGSEDDTDDDRSNEPGVLRHRVTDRLE